MSQRESAACNACCSRSMLSMPMILPGPPLRGDEDGVGAFVDIAEADVPPTESDR